MSESTQPQCAATQTWVARDGEVIGSLACVLPAGHGGEHWGSLLTMEDGSDDE
jgi:hypothetical protein